MKYDNSRRVKRISLISERLINIRQNVSKFYKFIPLLNKHLKVIKHRTKVR